MTPEEAIVCLKGMQNKKVDYAEMVCAPAFCSGYEYVYPEPEDYAIEEAGKVNSCMEYFKKCPKCGRYMAPFLQSKFGYVYTLWTCACGYSENIGNTGANDKTTYTGGRTSDRAGSNRSFKDY